MYISVYVFTFIIYTVYVYIFQKIMHIYICDMNIFGGVSRVMALKSIGDKTNLICRS